MALTSILTPLSYIAEGSEATPGLFNRVFSQLSDNIRAVAVGTPPTFFVGSAMSTTPASGLVISVPSTGTDYVYFNDSSAARSNYIIGSHVGGTADGLNIWDDSGQTMIASFSKQSVRFWQNIVGPVFDVGGSLQNTLNAAAFGIASQSTESRIQAALNAASASNVSRVYLPNSFYPYSASSVSFIDTVQLVREGGEYLTYDVRAYGAASGGVVSCTSAFAAAMSAISTAGGGSFLIPQGTWLADPPPVSANCLVIGDGKGRSIVNAETVNGRWTATDKSNIELRDFSFVGKSNSGAAATAQAVYFYSTATDITDITIKSCAFTQFKPNDAVVRVAGNGDLVTAATAFARRLKIDDCSISQYYDTNSASLAVQCNAIYLFGGTGDAWIGRNIIDGSSGKHGIVVQSEGSRIHVEDNTVNNAGWNNATFGYGIVVYSSYITAQITGITVARNIITGSSRAGIYFAAVSNWVIADNVMNSCDSNSAGIGVVGTGAISLNLSQGGTSDGPGALIGNQIGNPGYTSIYCTSNVTRGSPVVITGNVCKSTVTLTSRAGLVINGRNIVANGNTFRGFTQSIFLYTNINNDVGDLTLSGNEIDSSGLVNAQGIVNNSATTIGPLNIVNNRFTACIAGITAATVSDMVVANNQFSGTSTAITTTSIRGAIVGNISDGGTNGIVANCRPGLATAKLTIMGNVMAFCTTPSTVSQSTGQAIIGLNDFGGIPQTGGNNGDTSVTFSPSLEVNQWKTTLTSNRTQTLNTTGVQIGQRVRIVRNAVTPGAFTMAVVNNGASATTLYTIPINVNGFVDAQYDGANWILTGYATF